MKFFCNKNILKLISGFVTASIFMGLVSCSKDSKEDTNPVSGELVESATEEDIREEETEISAEQDSNERAGKINYGFNQTTKTLTINGNGGSIKNYDLFDSVPGWAKYSDIVEKIVIKDTVRIGQNAFANENLLLPDKAISNPYSNVKSIVLQEGLKEIGDSAFSRIGTKDVGSTVVNYINLSIPDSLEKINKSAFAYSGVNSLNFSYSSKLSYIGESAFYSCRLSFLNLPNNLTDIGSNSFANNRSLQTVYFPKSLHNIETSAFERCDIKSVQFPENIDYLNICDKAFQSNTNLNTVYIPEGAEIIDSNVFAYCNLKNLVLPKRYEKYITDILGKSPDSSLKITYI